MFVNTETLKASAKIMEGKNTQYNQEWNRLYTEVESLLETSFKSDASTEFKIKLDAYKDDFESLGKVINDYVVLLNTVAQRYEQVVEENKNKASSLPTGN